jgi:hypothetical protein
MCRKESIRAQITNSSVCGIMVAAFALFSTASAHQAQSGWTYPVECCSDTQDCQAISGGDVSMDDQGYIVTLKPGEHRHAPEGGTFYMLDNQVKQSGDDNFHVCIHEYTNGPGAICLYIPTQGLSSLRWKRPTSNLDLAPITVSMRPR